MFSTFIMSSSGACDYAACDLAACDRLPAGGITVTVAEQCIAEYLVASGLGTAGTDIFVNTKPATPDNIISVFGYAGRSPDQMHDSCAYARPGIQVWIRDTSAATGRTRVESVFNLLDGMSNISLSGTFFLLVQGNQSPMPMGDDENGRKEFAVNFSTIIRR